MKTLCAVLVLAVGMGFGMVGCNDNADPLVAPNDQATTQSEAISLAKGGPVHSASGNAQIPINFSSGVVPKDWDVIRVFTFNAKEYADGSYGGRCMNNVAPDFAENHVKGNVTQLVVEDNKAKIMWVAPWAGLGDHDWAFVVIDNGEGNNADPDMVTFAWAAPAGSQDALDMKNRSVQEALDFIGGVAPLYLGNAQVR